MASKLDVKKLGELQLYLLHRDLCHVHFHKALCGEAVISLTSAWQNNNLIITKKLVALPASHQLINVKLQIT